MTRKVRFILLILFSLVFIIITPFVVLNARGYQLSFEEKTLFNTSGIYLKSTPKQASVYINNKLLKRQTPIIIRGLAPGRYLVKVELDGFHGWTKYLETEPEMVAKKDNILLLPLSPKTEPIKILPIMDQEQNENFEYNSHEIYFKEKLVVRYAETIKQAFLYKDHDHVIFLVGNQVKFAEIDGSNIINFIGADKILYQQNQLYIQNNKSWFATNFD